MKPEKVERFAEVAHRAGVDVVVETPDKTVTGEVMATDGGIDMLLDWIPYEEVERITFDFPEDPQEAFDRLEVALAGG